MKKKYYYEILKLENGRFLVEIDEIVIRIDFKLEIKDLESMIHSLENITYIQDADIYKMQKIQYQAWDLKSFVMSIAMIIQMNIL